MADAAEHLRRNIIVPALVEPDGLNFEEYVRSFEPGCRPDGFRVSPGLGFRLGLPRIRELVQEHNGEDSLVLVDPRLSNLGALALTGDIVCAMKSCRVDGVMLYPDHDWIAEAQAGLLNRYKVRSIVGPQRGLERDERQVGVRREDVRWENAFEMPIRMRVKDFAIPHGTDIDTIRSWHSMFTQAVGLGSFSLFFEGITKDTDSDTLKKIIGITTGAANFVIGTEPYEANIGSIAQVADAVRHVRAKFAEFDDA